MRALLLMLFLLTTAPALGQIPAGPGQTPGTLVPAPPVIPPPPLVAPPPVPSVVTPLPQQTYGVPRGVTYPTTTRVSPVFRYEVKPKPPYKKKRRPRTSEILLIRTI